MAKNIQPKLAKKRVQNSSNTSKRGFIQRGLVFLLIFVLAAIVSIHFFKPQIEQAHTLMPKLDKTAENSPAPMIQQATASTSPKKTPHPIPTNSGRTVNVPIIYYHYIGKNPNPADKLRDNLSMDPELFEQQMAYISTSGYKPITFDTLLATLKGNATLPAKPIIITFDDGYVDFYVNAFPILRKYNLQATEFIPTGLVGTAYYLHWEQIKEMDKTGLISFEAHSITHANLPSLNDSELNRQLLESKKTLETQLGKPVNFMAYPYGASNERVWLAVKAAGYIGAAGTWVGSSESEGSIYDMPRIKIPGGISLENFKHKF